MEDVRRVYRLVFTVRVPLFAVSLPAEVPDPDTLSTVPVDDLRLETADRVDADRVFFVPEALREVTVLPVPPDVPLDEKVSLLRPDLRVVPEIPAVVNPRLFAVLILRADTDDVFAVPLATVSPPYARLLLTPKPASLSCLNFFGPSYFGL